MGASRVNMQRRWLIGAGCAALIARVPAMPPERFRIFDGLLHRGKPDLTRVGLERIALLADIWRPHITRDVVDETGVLAAVDRLPAWSKTLYIDIEQWPLFPAPVATRNASLDKLVRVAQLVRRERPELKFGFYGAPPVCVYWPIMRHDESYRQWLTADRAIAPLAHGVDYVFPSLYTFYDDRAGWLRFAAAQIEEARSYGKPVYPFLWYQYFDGNPMLSGHEIPAEVWEEELRFCRAHADGIVLWGGSERGWSQSAAWWQVTRQVFNLPEAF
jgi:hypothetical protein